MNKNAIKFIIISIGILFFVGITVWGFKSEESQTSTAYIPPPPAQFDPGHIPAMHHVKAGEWSDWVFIMGRKVTIFPGDAQVEYELKDPHGNVRTERKARDWKDMTQWQRFRSKVDIYYTVERL